MVLPSTKERTETSRPVMNSSMTRLISGRAEFLVGHDLLDALFCLIEVLADQNAFSESQAVGFENDGEYQHVSR